MAGQRREAERSLKTLSDGTVAFLARAMCWPGAAGASPRALRKMLNMQKHRKQVVEFMMIAQFDKNIKLGLALEEEWYREVQVFVPPVSLLDRHPGFEVFGNNMRSMMEDDDDEKIKADYGKLKKTVPKEWKANITVLDGVHDGPENISLDAFTIVQQTGLFNKKHVLKIKTLALMGEKLKVELICGEVNQELSKVRLGTDSRPAEFPKKFTRIWLSNIPDYTHGTLSTAMCVLPALQDNIEPAVTSNCMFNSPVWKDDDEFCYNHTLLLPKDLERYLGFRTLRGQAVQTFLTLSPLPLLQPLTALVSREKLHSWLARLLLSLVSPGTAQARPKLVKLPNNLVAFVQLLLELRNIGYLSHWLLDFIHAVLGGILLVDHLTYKGGIPRPVTELRQKSPPHRVRLDPWYAELETILISARQGSPFAVQIPAEASSGAKTAEGIGLYKASPVSGVLFDSPLFMLPPYDNVVYLLFCKETSEISERSLESLIRELLQTVDGRA